MQELGNGGHSTKASEARIAQSELPALLLPQPRPRIDDPDRGKAPVVEPVNPPPRLEEAPSKPDPDYVNPTVGGQSA
jgi:hypothetical protein